MGQIERGFNRIYGIERDRPSVRKYGRALARGRRRDSGLAIAFLVFALGRDSETTGRCCGRVALAALAARSRRRDARAPRCCAGRRIVASPRGRGCSTAPRSRSPGGLSSPSCSARRSASARRSVRPYGPLAGIVALQFWTLLSAIAIFFGAAVAAQLEAVRAGATRPRIELCRARAQAGRRVDVLRVVDPTLQRAEKSPVFRRDAGELHQPMREVLPSLQALELLVGDRHPSSGR